MAEPRARLFRHLQVSIVAVVAARPLPLLMPDQRIAEMHKSQEDEKLRSTRTSYHYYFYYSLLCLVFIAFTRDLKRGKEVLNNKNDKFVI